MKQQDIATIIVIAVISAGISLFVSNLLFTSGKNAELTVSKIDLINSDFAPPSNKYFNSEALNPTMLVKIGDSTHENPFSNNGQ